MNRQCDLVVRCEFVLIRRWIAPTPHSSDPAARSNRTQEEEVDFRTLAVGGDLAFASSVHEIEDSYNVVVGVGTMRTSRTASEKTDVSDLRVTGASLATHASRSNGHESCIPHEYVRSG
jgi:hypothetical protein